MKNIKIQHVYTVVREFKCKPKELEEEKDSFKGVQDEVGEFLYGYGGAEKIKVEMFISKDNGKTWEAVKE